MGKKRFNLIALAVIIGLFTQKTSGQVFQWVNRAGGTTADIGSGIVADKAGNIYVTGYFTSTANFDSTHSLTSNGSSDVFIAKYNKGGGLLWVIQVGGTGADQGNAIAADTSGYIYVTGNYSGNVTFGSSTTLTATGTTDAFIAKYDTSGNLQWAVSQGGSGTENGNGIAVDNGGNVFVIGLNNPSGSAYNISVAKYTGSGYKSWYQIIKGINAGQAIALDDSSNIYLTGTYSGNFWVAKYDSTFNASNKNKPTWEKTDINPSNTDVGYGITVDNGGNVYAVGQFSGTNIKFDTKTASSVGGNNGDMVIWKLSRGGVTSWVQTAGGTYNDQGNAISVNRVGDIYITGYYTGDVIFDTTHVSGPNYPQIFIAKYDPFGNVKWVIKDGGATTSNNMGNGIFVDVSSNVYTTGEFTSFAVFGTDSILTPSQKPVTNIFVAKYSDVITWDSALFSVNDTVECYTSNKFTFTNASKTNAGKLSYMWKFGDSKTNTTSISTTHSYSKPGFYNVTLIASTTNGYIDSTSIIVHADQPNPGFYNIPGRGWGTDSFINYQWYISSNHLITGDTSRILTSPVKGNNYSVKVTDKNGCTYHSAQFEYTASGSGISPAFYNQLSVYPNPTNGSFFIENPSDIDKIDNITVYNMFGRSVYFDSDNSDLSQARIEVKLNQKGIYIVKLQAGGSVYEQKIIVE